MSGGKFALPFLAANLLAQMMLAQAAAGAAAGAIRGEAEDEERSKRLDEARNRMVLELQESRRQITEPDAVYPAHRLKLLSTHDAILEAVIHAATEKELWQHAGAIPLLQADIKTARMNQRFHSAREAAQEHDWIQMRLDELTRGLTHIGTPEMAALDPAGHEAAIRAIAAARDAVNSGAGDPANLLEIAAEAIALHGRRGAERRADQMEQSAHFERAATEMLAIVAGLRRDPMVGKWQAAALASLEELVRSTPADADAPFVMEMVRERAAEMVKAASDAQFKADTRDYITGSIAQSLSEMGFVVGATLDEHPDHPGTAKVFQASSASGKSVLVSVPIEGQVWYEVDGYTKTTSASITGEVALACDEGERILEEMHAKLDEEFQVGMSEILWDGKDPDRLLRRADSLPVSANISQGAVR